MKYLIIETFPSSPHLEASMEIAINLKKKGNDVLFFWAGYDLPWVDWKLPIYKKLLLFSYESKLRKVVNYLKSKSINIIEDPKLDYKVFKKIDFFLKKIKKIENLKFLKYNKKVPIGLGVYSSLISKHHTSNLKNLKHLSMKAVKSGCIIFERSNKIIRSTKPDVILTFNSRFAITKPILEAAKLNKVKIFSHERGSVLNKYEIFKGDMFDQGYASKHIETYCKRVTNLLKKNNIDEKYFKKIKNKSYFKKIGFNYDDFNKKKIKFDKNKKIITYFCTTDYEHQAISNKIKRFYINKNWSEQINTINSITKIIKNDPDILFLIKAHPNFIRAKELENKIKKIKYKNIKYISASDRIDSIHLIKNSDIIFTFGSSLELYSAYCEKKVFSFFKSWWYNFNIVIYPRNNSDLKKLIYTNKKWFNKSKRRINLFKISYYIMTFGIKFKYFEPLDHSKGFFKDRSINHYGPLINYMLNFNKMYSLFKKLVTQ